jgi:hypothetical protein
MKKKLSLLMALAAGAAVHAQEAPPAPAGGDGGGAVVAQATLVDANGAVVVGENQETKIKLAAPQAGDPKLTHAKGLVGKGKLAGREYTVVVDGSKADGDLDVFKVMAADGKGTAEAKLQAIGPQAYMASAMVFLPGSDMACQGIFCQLKAGDSNVTFFQLMKALKASVDFAGKAEEVIVLDMNQNGKLGDPFVFPRDKDGFLSLGGEKMVMGDLASIGETQLPLGMPFLRNDAQWTMAIADGKITVQRQDSKMGTIAWKGDGTEGTLMLVGKTMLITDVQLKDGCWTLPVGDYRIVSLTYKQGKGHVMVTGDGGKVLTVAADKPSEIGAVTSAVAKVAAAPLTPQRDLALSLKTLTPEGYNVMFTAEGPEAPKPPAIRILDAAGKEVHKGNFEYG